MKLKRLFTAPLSEVLRGVLRSGRDRESILEELEEQLILADVSAPLVDSLLRKTVAEAGFPFDADEFITILRGELETLLRVEGTAELQLTGEKNVIMLVGINGCGKTTTAAKLARYCRHNGHKVLMAAADTFRAAGSSQLTLWGERLRMPVIGGERGADPGSVVYNSITSLMSRDLDLLVVDTAGRVQTRRGLMEELSKLTRIMDGLISGQPAEVLLVVDATMGQNTLDQARCFREFSGITGIILTKMDGTARGGNILNILSEMKLPVKFAGTGEAAEDLEPFSIPDFLDALLPG